MRAIQMITMVSLTMTGVLTDLWCGKIYNGLIVTGLLFGLLYQLFSKGLIGLILFLGGVILPLLLFAGLYYFRMIGAGDIKLICVVSGFLGPLEGMKFLISALIWGGIISAGLLIRRGGIMQRMQYFLDYVNVYSRERKWRPYLIHGDKSARFCFSIPILMGLLWYIGGVI